MASVKLFDALGGDVIVEKAIPMIGSEEEVTADWKAPVKLLKFISID